MNKSLIAVLLSVLTVVGIMATVSFADSGVSEVYTDETISSSLLAQETYTDAFGMDVLVTSYSADPTKEGQEVIAYVINHCGEYPGTESDVSIVSDYISKGNTVVVLDYKKNPLAVSPTVETSVAEIYTKIRTAESFVGGAVIDTAKVFVVPSGYRIARDVVYFEMASHSSQAALDHIVNKWNTQEQNIKAVYNKFGEEYATKTDNGDGTYTYALTDKAYAEDIFDIIMKDGHYMTVEDTQLKMDIIYPSQPRDGYKAPVSVLASSGTPRSNGMSHATRVHNIGFLFRGYVGVCYDHEYYPFINLDNGGWGHMEPAYTIQGYDGIKTHTAAIRCVKYYADEFGYSAEKIGVFGHSKSSWSSLLSNPASENLPENGGTYAAIGEQPFLKDVDGNELNADITCSYHSMGNGSARYAKYLTTQNVPTIICNGQKDSGNGNSYWEKEKAAYIKSGIDFLAIPMEDEGHTYPIGDDTVYDYNRYVAFCKFFDYYLKDTEPEILYTSVNEGQLKDLKTTTDKYSSTSEKWSVIEGDKLFVQFVAPVTEWSFLKAVTLEDANGNAIEGTWYAEGNGNKWIFDGKLVDGTSYTLTVADNAVSDKYGRTVEQGIEVTFTK